MHFTLSQNPKKILSTFMLSMSLMTVSITAQAAKACPASTNVEIQMPDSTHTNVRITAHLPNPVKAPNFAVPAVLTIPPKTLDAGQSWAYTVDGSKTGAMGQNMQGKQWALMSLPLLLPEELLIDLEKLSICSSTGGVNRIGMQLLLGPGWQMIPGNTERPAIYHVRSDQEKVYANLANRLLNRLKAWKLQSPKSLPTVVIYEHKLPKQVFSGVNEGKSLSFVVPHAVSESTLLSEGTPVFAHELLHLFTGKGQFSSPYGLQSTDKILREGVLTYGGLVLAHQAGLLSESEFKTRLNAFVKESADVPDTPLRPILPTPGWMRQAYFRGALLTHALTLELAPKYSFQDFFKVLIEAPGPLVAEDLAKLVQTHFHKDIDEILHSYLYTKAPDAN